MRRGEVGRWGWRWGGVAALPAAPDLRLPHPTSTPPRPNPAPPYCIPPRPRRCTFSSFSRARRCSRRLRGACGQRCAVLCQGAAVPAQGDGVEWCSVRCGELGGGGMWRGVAWCAGATRWQPPWWGAAGGRQRGKGAPPRTRPALYSLCSRHPLRPSPPRTRPALYSLLPRGVVILLLSPEIGMELIRWVVLGIRAGWTCGVLEHVCW